MIKRRSENKSAQVHWGFKVISLTLLQALTFSVFAQLHWTNVAYLIITGPTLQKVSNVSTAWNAGAISQENFYADGWIEFRFPANKYAVMGLSPHNTSASLSTIKYGIHAHINGYIYVYENGQELTNIGKYRAIQLKFTATDKLRVERVGSTIHYKKNGVVFYTSTKPSTGPLHVDCSFNLASSIITVTDYMFGVVWTGAVNDNWNEPGNWNVNRVPMPTDQAIVNECSI